MSNPEVSVVVPSYNPGHFLEWTLDSIANQAFKNFECIIVDDCSTDDSFTKAKKRFTDKRFRFIRHHVNSGSSAARNTGIRAAKGEFVAFLDADDLMMADSLARRVSACRWARRTSDRFAGSFCGSMQINEKQKVAPDTAPQNLDFVSFVSSNGHCPFNMNQPMIRRDILRAAGGFNTVLSQAEDFDLWLRILRAGYMFAPAHFCAVTYRKREGSMVRRQPIGHLENSLAIVNSSEQPLRPDQLSWSSYRMPKPHSDYANQQRKIGRVFQFIGMNLATTEPESLDTVGSLIQSELPDIDLISYSDRMIEDLIHSGIRRQRSISGEIGKDDAERAKLVLALVKSGPRDTPVALPSRTVYSDDAKDRPWYSGLQGRYQVVFVPHKAYHVWTISLIGQTLNELGVEFITVDISAEWREGGVRDEAAKHGLELISLGEFALGRYAPRAIVTFNDWDPVTRPIIISAKASGIRTIAIVEGIQDYGDADVHWKRYAYKTSDAVLLPGDFDKKYFEGHTAIVASVGVPRIESLRIKPKREWSKDVTPRVLINCNFSYGVLIEHRDRWLTEAVEAVLELGMTPVISRHPGDTGVLFPEYVTSENFYDAMERCEVSIQRFASGVLECLARDIGVIYFNPHGEKVDKFQADPMGAYWLAFDKASLTEQLKDWWKLHVMAMEKGPAFLDHHAGPMGEGSAVRCANALNNLLGGEPDPVSLSTFRKNLQVLDENTAAFSQVRVNNEPLFQDPATAKDKLLEMGGKSYQPMENPMTELSHTHNESTADFLCRIADDKTKDTTFLRSLASHLLTDGKNAISFIESERSIQNAIDRARKGLPADSALLTHFNKVMEFAQQKYA